MSKLGEVAHLDGTAQAQLVRRKEVQAVELVEAAIERIERLNPTLNAVVTPMYDEARAAAKELVPGGPFSGVPFLLKDLLALQLLQGLGRVMSSFTHLRGSTHG